MTDLTFIRDLRLRAHLGITDEERRSLQDVVLNIEIEADQRKGAKSDDVNDVVDYRALNKRIIALVESSEHHLVETLAQRVAHLCLDDARIEAISVRVEKPGALRFADSVGVDIRRTRREP